MKKNKSDLSIFITDYSIGLFQYNESNESLSNYGTIMLDSGIVENGYLHDPVALLKLLNTFFKEKSIKPRLIRLVIQEQNVLVREIVVKKSDLQKRSIDSFLSDAKNTGLNFPFPNPILSHFIKSENEEEYKAILFIADEKLLSDYNDVFDRLGAKEFKVDLPSLVLYQCYAQKTEYNIANTLLVTLFERMLSIHVFEEGIPVFSMIEELEGSGEAFYDTIESYIERIANYYRYNLRKDKNNIYNALIFNLTDRVDQETFVEKMGLRLKSFITTLVDMSEFDAILFEQQKVTHLAYASNRLGNQDIKLKVNFKIERLNKSKLYANYILVLALAVFSVFTLLYIPYQLNLQVIQDYANTNASLALQIEALKSELLTEDDYPQAQIDYNDAYNYLIDQELSPSDYLDDLLIYVTGTLSVTKYTVDSKTKKITIVISSNTEFELSEYIIQIYETYGITINSTDLSRWMMDSPIRKNISTFVMEVTVYYA